jgi:hypothetical protein
VRARPWRLFLTGSAHQFEYGHLSVHQAPLAKSDDRGRVTLPRERSGKTCKVATARAAPSKKEAAGPARVLTSAATFLWPYRLRDDEDLEQ